MGTLLWMSFTPREILLKRKAWKTSKTNIPHLYITRSINWMGILYESKYHNCIFNTWKNDKYRRNNLRKQPSQVYVEILFHIICTRHSTQHKSLWQNSNLCIQPIQNESRIYNMGNLHNSIHCMHRIYCRWNIPFLPILRILEKEV